MRAVTPSLCEAACAARGRHAPDCPDPDECPGCLRRLAADGVRLCEVHTERLIEDLIEAPRLYADLGAVLVHATPGGERAAGSATAGPVPDEDVMEARGAIRSALIRLTRTIVDERGVRAPLATRDGRTYVDTRVPALAGFCVPHAIWLAAHRDAGRWADMLHEATRGKVRTMAYPSGSDRLYVGECPIIVAAPDGERVCGTRLYQLPDEPLITCTGCATSETIEQWQRWLVGEARGTADVFALSAHLALLWMRPVDPALIRQWSHRGRIHPVMRADPAPGDPDRQALDKDERGRVRYPIADVVAYAESIWGPPYRKRRAG